MAMINPSFEPDDELPSRFPPAKVITKKDGTHSVELQEASGKYWEESEEQYEPYEHRDVRAPTTNLETFVHLMKGSLGTGILAMPIAFYNAGYSLGTFGTILIGTLCTYCIHNLVKLEYELCKRRRLPSLTYPNLAKGCLEEGPPICRAMAYYSVFVVNAFLLVYQIGTCCVYVVFISENLKKVVDTYLAEPIDLKIYMTIILIPLILLNWVRDLKRLAPLSIMANVVTICSFGIILYYLFREPLTMEGKDAFGKVENYPLFFGTVLFALEAIGVILPLENAMKTPQHFGGSFGILNKAMTLIIILYVAMGLFGYLKYGSDSLGSITLNLPSETELPAKLVQIFLAIAIYVTHGLACYVAIDIAWNQYLLEKVKNSKLTIYYEYAVRTGIVLITYLLAISVPSLELFISLFGALCLSALGLAFPSICVISAYWYHIEGKAFYRMVIINGVIIVIGFFGLVVGTSTSLKAIIIEFS